MKKINLIFLSMLATVSYGQIVENDTLKIVKSSLEPKLNEDAMYELKQSFNMIYPSCLMLSDFSNNVKDRTSYRFIYSNRMMRDYFPSYEQIRTNRFNFQMQTNYKHPFYYLQKGMCITYSFNDKVAIYVKGNFGLLRQQSIYTPGYVQPVSFGTGVSFKLDNQKVLDIGLKYEYTLRQGHIENCKKWNSLTDCTLHF